MRRSVVRPARPSLRCGQALRLTVDEIAELDDRKEELFREMLRNDFRAIPGARQLIVELKQRRFRPGRRIFGSSGERVSHDRSVAGPRPV